MRKFVVGDIHGCYDELVELIEMINLKDEDLLIALGDIVDRGNKSKEVYQYLKDRPNTVVLMGNHERKHQRGVLSYAQDIVKVQFGNDYNDFLLWVNTLGYYYETEEAIIIHAFFEHDKALHDQREEVLCGSTSGDRYLESKYPPNTHWTDVYSGSKPVIYGHHVVGHVPKVVSNTYGIDTGCCHGDFLTAIELPSFTVHQVKAKKDYWKQEQRAWQIPVLKAKAWNEMQFTEIEKQLAKLEYIEEPETRKYLDEIRRWKDELLQSIDSVKSEIDKFTNNLLQAYGDDFTKEANEYIFKTYLFKSRARNLTKQDLVSGLNTPQKLMALKEALKIV